MTRPCPICHTPVSTEPPARPASFPFCCERCRMRDLGLWLEEGYSVPVETSRVAQQAVDQAEQSEGRDDPHSPDYDDESFRDY